MFDLTLTSKGFELIFFFGRNDIILILFRAISPINYFFFSEWIKSVRARETKTTIVDFRLKFDYIFGQIICISLTVNMIFDSMECRARIRAISTCNVSRSMIVPFSSTPFAVVAVFIFFFFLLRYQFNSIRNQISTVQTSS